MSDECEYSTPIAPDSLHGRLNLLKTGQLLLEKFVERLEKVESYLGGKKRNNRFSH